MKNLKEIWEKRYEDLRLKPNKSNEEVQELSRLQIALHSRYGKVPIKDGR